MSSRSSSSSPESDNRRSKRSRSRSRSRRSKRGHSRDSSQEECEYKRKRGDSKSYDNSPPAVMIKSSEREVRGEDVLEPRNRGGDKLSSKLSHHGKPVDEASSDSSDEDRDDNEKKRQKKLKRVDLGNPFSTFQRQTKNKKKYKVPSSFVKSNWLTIRGMDSNGKFATDEDPRPDAWKYVAKSDYLVKKYSGDIFAESKLDDGLHSIVNKGESSADKDLIRSQRVLGSIGHLALNAMESYGSFYHKIIQFVSRNIGDPKDPNPDWKEGDPMEKQFVYSEYQSSTWAEFNSLLKELQLDVSEPISNITRVAASAYTRSLEVRRENLISRIKKNNPKAATAIGRIPPSASSMFGGDHSQLEKVVKLTRDLHSSSSKARGSEKGYSSFRTPQKKGENSGSSYRSRNKEDTKKISSNAKPRGGNSFRGGKQH